MNRSGSAWDALWGRWIVEELVRNGITFFCISPGSRSTPLTVSVAENSRAQSKVCIDERAAAYFALGYARATGRAAVLIATSGTAVANHLPAIVEASMEHIPMIVLTADRPPELHDCGAPQTIEQNGIFGAYVRWFHNPGCPGSEMPVEALLSTIDYAVQRTKAPLAGPVHLNVPFREPFLAHSETTAKTTPITVPQSWQSSDAPYICWATAQKSPDKTILDALVQARPHRGILSVGRIPITAQPAVKRLAEVLHWPLFADVASGMRLGTDCTERIAYSDSLLLAIGDDKAWQPEAIWHLGFPPLSKRLLTFLEKSTAPQKVWIADHSLRHDPTHCFSWRVESDLSAFCDACIDGLVGLRCATSPWIEQWQSLDMQTDTLMARHFDTVVLRDTTSIPSEAHLAHFLSQQVPNEHGFFIGNSLPARMINGYGSGRGTTARVALNRGASGIDGLIASAAGYAEGLRQPVTLLIGDLSTLHDLNSLALLENSAFPVFVVLCNNQGGGIFSFLPIAEQRRDLFEPFFGTPHQCSFRAASQSFGLDYYAADSLADFKRFYRAAVSRARSIVIEVSTERTANVVEEQRWHDFFLANLRWSTSA